MPRKDIELTNNEAIKLSSVLKVLYANSTEIGMDEWFCHVLKHNYGEVLECVESFKSKTNHILEQHSLKDENGKPIMREETFYGFSDEVEMIEEIDTLSDQTNSAYLFVLNTSELFQLKLKIKSSQYRDIDGLELLNKFTIKI